MIELIVADAGHTLGIFDEPMTTHVLAELSPLSEDYIAEEVRRLLHTAPELTEDVITTVCNALLIDPARWPSPWPGRGFTLYPYTLDALADLTAIAPVVVLSNVPVVGCDERMEQLRHACAPYIQAIYTSYAMRMRKPDRRLWQGIGRDFHVSPENMVHVGDQWIADVHGAISAGARAIYTNTRHKNVPPTSEWPQPRDRIAIAADLRGTAQIIREWNREGAAA